MSSTTGSLPREEEVSRSGLVLAWLGILGFLGWLAVVASLAWIDDTPPADREPQRLQLLVALQDARNGGAKEITLNGILDLYAGPRTGAPSERETLKSTLAQLVGEGLVERTGKRGYRITPAGDAYVAREGKRPPG